MQLLDTASNAVDASRDLVADITDGTKASIGGLVDHTVAAATPLAPEAVTAARFVWRRRIIGLGVVIALVALVVALRARKAVEPDDGQRGDPDATVPRP